MNPFELKPMNLEKSFQNWSQMSPKPYDKNEVNPYTKLRIVLMNGTEFEATKFLHQFHRQCGDNDLRRELAMCRRIEQQQQKRIAGFKPVDESILEHTIAYEQLAVDLTVALALLEKDKYVKQCLDFALLEDFDHLYRYSDLLESETGIKGERLVGKYTEIMPGRPTISEHRFPMDDVKRHICNKSAAPNTKLNVSIITAAEQQTMNYYMNVANLAPTEAERKLYTEIGMIEEQHVTQYGSLIDTETTLLECMLMHEYTECYLYYSCYMDESDPNVKKTWEEFFDYEVAHLHRAAKLLKKYENKEWQEVIPEGAFPKLLQIKSNKDYVRNALKDAQETAHLENFCKVTELPENDSFFKYQNIVNKKTDMVATHTTIEDYIRENGQDYRFEEKAHPIKELRDRTTDNITVGRAEL